VPVYVQLLGSDCQAMASNAKRLVELGAPGIDINFGCPAKTVNRHGGGSALLRTPDRVVDIVGCVRDAVDVLRNCVFTPVPGLMVISLRRTGLRSGRFVRH